MTTNNPTCLKRKWNRWTDSEDQQILSRYAIEGTSIELPGRSREDIRKRAKRLRVRAILAITPRMTDYFEQRWLTTWPRDIPAAPRSVFDLAR